MHNPLPSVGHEKTHISKAMAFMLQSAMNPEPETFPRIPPVWVALRETPPGDAGVPAAPACPAVPNPARAVDHPAHHPAVPELPPVCLRLSSLLGALSKVGRKWVEDGDGTTPFAAGRLSGLLPGNWVFFA